MTQVEKPLLVISRGFPLKTFIISLLIGIAGVYLISVFNPSQLHNLLIAYMFLAVLFLITGFTNRPKFLCFEDRLVYRSLGITIVINYSDLISVKLSFPRTFGIIDSISSYAGMLRAARGQEGLIAIESKDKKIVFGIITFKKEDIKNLIDFIKQHSPQLLIDNKLSEILS